jgi:hypothetical protein
MRSKVCLIALCAVVAGFSPTAQVQTPATTPPVLSADDPVKMLVERLDLEKYKATVKGLTQFGDRRQGTDRNRAAVEWIEAQLKSYGCPTERIKYDYNRRRPNPAAADAAAATRGSRRAAAGRAASARRPASTPIR